MPGPDVLLLQILGLGALVLTLWALADALYRPAPGFPAAGKWSKPTWVAILLVAVLFLYGTSFMGLFGLVSLVATIVYLVDVRPAVREITSGGPWR